MIQEQYRRTVFLLTVLSTFLMLSLSGCGNKDVNSSDETDAIDLGADIVGSGYYQNELNSSRLIGGTIGTQQAANRDLRKTLRLQLENENENFEIGNLYATRNSSDSNVLRWIVSVKNVSSSAHRFVFLNDIVFADANGQALVPSSDQVPFSTMAIVYANTDAASYSGTTIQPGETVYAVGIESGIYDNVAQINIGSISSTGQATMAAEKILPSSYTASTASSQTNLGLTITNTGVIDATADSSLLMYILLDSSGLPLHWSFLRAGGSETSRKLVSNESFEIAGSVFYDGNAAGVRAVVKIVEPEAVAAFKSSPNFSAKPLPLGNADLQDAFDADLIQLINEQAVQQSRR